MPSNNLARCPQGVALNVTGQSFHTASTSNAWLFRYTFEPFFRLSMFSQIGNVDYMSQALVRYKEALDSCTDTINRARRESTLAAGNPADLAASAAATSSNNGNNGNIPNNTTSSSTAAATTTTTMSANITANITTDTTTGTDADTTTTTANTTTIITTVTTGITNPVRARIPASPPPPAPSTIATQIIMLVQERMILLESLQATYSHTYQHVTRTLIADNAYISPDALADFRRRFLARMQTLNSDLAVLASRAGEIILFIENAINATAPDSTPSPHLVDAYLSGQIRHYKTRCSLVGSNSWYDRVALDHLVRPMFEDQGRLSMAIDGARVAVDYVTGLYFPAQDLVIANFVPIGLRIFAAHAFGGANRDLTGMNNAILIHQEFATALSAADISICPVARGDQTPGFGRVRILNDKWRISRRLEEDIKTKAPSFKPDTPQGYKEYFQDRPLAYGPLTRPDQVPRRAYMAFRHILNVCMYQGLDPSWNGPAEMLNARPILVDLTNVGGDTFIEPLTLHMMACSIAGIPPNISSHYLFHGAVPPPPEMPDDNPLFTAVAISRAALASSIPAAYVLDEQEQGFHNYCVSYTFDFGTERHLYDESRRVSYFDLKSHEFVEGNRRNQPGHDCDGNRVPNPYLRDDQIRGILDWIRLPRKQISGTEREDVVPRVEEESVRIVGLEHIHYNSARWSKA